MKALFTTLALLSVPLCLQAGYTFKMETTSQDSQKPEALQMWVDGDNLKVQTPSSGGEMIFHGADKTFVAVDDQHKSYTVMDEATIKQIGEKMAQVRQQMANMPEAMRKMMEQRMPQPTTPPEIKVEKTGETQTINGYKTTKVIIYTDGQKSAEAWVADAGKVQGSKEYMAVIKEMASFMQEMMQQMGMAHMQASKNAMIREMGNMEGFPIKVESYKDGKVSSTMNLVSADEAKLSKADFSPPKGYKEHKIQMGPH